MWTPPTSRRRAASIASSRRSVKMPVARPNGVALTRSIASSSVAKGAMHTTGPKISQQPTCILSFISANKVGGTTGP